MAIDGMGEKSVNANQDVENLLRGGAFSNFSHRDALRKRLFAKNAVLSLDDLEGVTGGVMTDTPKFEDWPDDPFRL